MIVLLINDKIKRILIIRLSSLGDILLTTPLLKVIKRLNKNIEIDFLLKEQFVQALEFNPNINKLVFYSKENKKELLKNLKTSNYDLCVDLQNNLRSLSLTKSLNIKTVKFNKYSLKKFLLVNLKLNYFGEYKSVAERYIETLEIPIDKNDLIPELYYPADYDKIAEEDIKLKGLEKKQIIGICPGAKHFTKTYPQWSYEEVIEMLLGYGFTVFLFGGIEEEKLCRNLMNIYGNIYNFQNDNNLYETAAFMKYCNLVITNDSSLMHLANALGKKIVAIFGSSVKEFGFLPSGVPFSLLENNELDCRPCSHFGRERCPEGHFKCMKDINPKVVFNETLSLLENE